MTMMMISLWLHVILYIGDAGASTCSKANMQLEEGRLTGNIIMSVTTDGPVSCASSCLHLTMCESFSYEKATGLCELSSDDAKPANIRHQVGFVVSNIRVWPSRLAASCANHACPANKMCEPQSQPVCHAVACLLSERPDIDNATLETSISDVIAREETVLVYKCDKNESRAKAVCKSDGSWKSTSCRLTGPSSCVDVQQCLPTSTDGEYWLYLPRFDFYRTRIYCNRMDSNSPEEYLTLPSSNYGSCVGNKREGYYWFRKIRLEVTGDSMFVYTGVTTFANLTNRFTHYGQAYGWYIPRGKTYRQRRSCSSPGYFIINLSGTGWMVSPNVTWLPVVSVNRISGAMVELRCRGHRNECITKGLVLVPNIGESLDETSAVSVKCSYDT